MCKQFEYHGFGIGIDDQGIVLSLACRAWPAGPLSGFVVLQIKEVLEEECRKFIFSVGKGCWNAWRFRLVYCKLMHT